MLNRDTINQLGERLRTRKKDLLDRLQITAETWSELHERQIELEEQAANESLAAGFAGLEEQVVLELGRIEKALRKIKDQRYGLCESCGRQIKAERLQAMPDAEKCMRCASRSASAPIEDEEEEGTGESGR
jgi:DnaK suppressor protein